MWLHNWIMVFCNFGILSAHKNKTKNIFSRLSFLTFVFSCTCQSWACPHDNSPLVQASIIKFGVLEQKIPIILGVDRPWPSRSNLTSKSKSIPFWTCLQDNLSLVQARITQFGPEMHISTVKIRFDFGLHKPSTSIIFLIVKAILVTYLRCFCITFSETSL